ncbi:MAG: alkaline phosphatase family protein [Myxococcota bacterium]|nr:alkaline phosphatase family protein [Myxococcota bacterium]
MRLAAVLFLVACSSQPKPPAPTPAPGSATGSAQPASIELPPAKAPKLVVLVVIDQWPQWAFVEKRPHLTKGFARLLRDGEWHTGRHPSAATLTAPGHALLGTGEPTATSGIISNEWWSREGARVIKAVEALDGSIGAHHLRVPALGDAMAVANQGAKAVGVSLKDRAAILPIGKPGLALWYDKKTGKFTSNKPPAWLAKLPSIKSRLDEPWTPLDAAKQLSKTTDDQKGEVGMKGFGPTFPHAAKKTKEALDAVFAMPLGNEIVFETALAAIDHEQLGADASPDLLVLSLSAHDYVAHGWGHESWEAWDMTLRLDEQLGSFLEALDTKLGDTWAMIATSDHGGARLPERTGGGRIAYEDIEDAANRAAALELGAGKWIVSAKYPSVVLAPAALAHKKRDQAVNKIILAIKAFPGIELAARTVDYAGNCDKRTGDAFAICLALDIERSGEIFYLPKRNWILEERDERLATAHGSLHDYDRDVPVIMLAPGRVSHAAQTAPSNATIQMVRIATVIARWLGVTPPSTLARLPAP